MTPYNQSWRSTPPLQIHTPRKGFPPSRTTPIHPQFRKFGRFPGTIWPTGIGNAHLLIGTSCDDQQLVTVNTTSRSLIILAGLQLFIDTMLCKSLALI